jgi:hypothetical protein
MGRQLGNGNGNVNVVPFGDGSGHSDGIATLPTVTPMMATGHASGLSKDTTARLVRAGRRGWRH